MKVPISIERELRRTPGLVRVSRETFMIWEYMRLQICVELILKSYIIVHAIKPVLLLIAACFASIDAQYTLPLIKSMIQSCSSGGRGKIRFHLTDARITGTFPTLK